MSLNYCDIELNALARCLAETPVSQCGCFGNFNLETYPETLERLFLTTQSYVPDTDPKFCATANSRICNYVVDNTSCCCGGYTETYRQCFFDEYLLEKYPRVLVNYCEATESCANDKTGENMDASALPGEEMPNNNGDDSSKNMMYGIAGGAVGALMLLVFLIFFCRRKSAKNENNTEEKDQDTAANKDNSEDADVEEAEGSTPFEEEVYIEQPQSPTVIPFTDTLPKQQVSKAAMTEDEAFRMKQEKLRKKRAAIEEWHDGKKQGSDRSLMSYMSDHGL